MRNHNIFVPFVTQVNLIEGKPINLALANILQLPISELKSSKLQRVISFASHLQKKEKKILSRLSQVSSILFKIKSKTMFFSKLTIFSLLCLKMGRNLKYLTSETIPPLNPQFDLKFTYSKASLLGYTYKC